MSIKSILVATDLSVQENGAVVRAQQLAHAHDAALKLLYVPPPGKPRAVGAAAQLAAMARQAETELLLDAQALPAIVQAFEDIAAKAWGVDLVVVPHRRERSVAAFFRGQPVVRLLRECTTPVLVTREGRGTPYQHVLVAVDFSGHSAALAELAAGFEADARLQLFHAISTRDESRLRFAEATEHAIEAFRERCREHARGKMLALATQLAPHGTRLLTKIGRGDAAHQLVLHQERSGADLVVVGKRQGSAGGDFLCGSVAHRVLEWGRSDVLVVPEAYMKGLAHAGSRHRRRLSSWPSFSLPPAERRTS